jgi:glycerol transport system permease protein
MEYDPFFVVKPAQPRDRHTRPNDATIWVACGLETLGDPHRMVLIAMDVWHWTSLVVILCYGALTTIPTAHYQAAAIDGARPWRVFRFIQFPKLQHVLLMAVLLRFMDSFMIYSEAFPINAGGPDGATMFLAVDLGEDIKAFNYGPSAARSVLYFLIVLTVAWAFTKTQAKLDREHAQ